MVVVISLNDRGKVVKETSLSYKLLKSLNYIGTLVRERYCRNVVNIAGVLEILQRCS